MEFLLQSFIFKFIFYSCWLSCWRLYQPTGNFQLRLRTASYQKMLLDFVISTVVKKLTFMKWKCFHADKDNRIQSCIGVPRFLPCLGILSVLCIPNIQICLRSFTDLLYIIDIDTLKTYRSWSLIIVSMSGTVKRKINKCSCHFFFNIQYSHSQFCHLLVARGLAINYALKPNISKAKRMDEYTASPKLLEFFPSQSQQWAN